MSVLIRTACKPGGAPLACGLVHRAAGKSVFIYVCVQEWLVPGRSPRHPESGPGALWAPVAVLYACYAPIASICCYVSRK